ncbi:MAG: chemotaxis protein CheD [Pseudomonadota bacterium]
MNTIVLQTGELALAGHQDTIVSGPLGSCIAAIIVESNHRLAGMAHIMLPGRHRTSSTSMEKNKFAENALENLIEQLMLKGANKDKLQAYLIGAGNVLKRADDTICGHNTSSTLAYLEKVEIPVIKSELGGEERRQVILDLAKSEIRYTVGNGVEKVFCGF